MHLKGIYAPLVTPFHADESINYPVLEQLIEHLIQNKISGLVPGGTTGEVYAYTDQERLEVFQFVKEKAGGRVALMAGVNAGATRDVIRFSQAAEGMGYDALMVAVPPYSRPSQRELLAHYRAVAESVSLPIVLYNFPWHAGFLWGSSACFRCRNIIHAQSASRRFAPHRFARTARFERADRRVPGQGEAGRDPRGDAG